MKNKTIANFLIGILGLTLLGGLFGIESGAGFYTIMGLGFYVFGILAIVRLYKLN